MSRGQQHQNLVSSTLFFSENEIHKIIQNLQTKLGENSYHTQTYIIIKSTKQTELNT